MKKENVKIEEQQIQQKQQHSPTTDNILAQLSQIESTYTDVLTQQLIPFKYKKSISLQDRVMFVNNVLDVLFKNDNYYSLLTDKVFDFMLVAMFTDILWEDKILWGDEDYTFSLRKVEEIVSQTDLLNILYENIDEMVLAELKETIELNIEHKTGIHRYDVSNAIYSLVNALEQKVNEINVGELENTLRQFADVSGGLSQASIIDLYTKTQAYKDNYEKVVGEKNKEIRALKQSK